MRRFIPQMLFDAVAKCAHFFAGNRVGGALLILLASIGPAYAQDLTWDSNGATAGSGGTGTWNTTSTTWFNGATYQAWNNASLDNAIFAGTAGNITLGTPITVHDMTFNVSGYLFPSLGTTALTFGGVNPTITTNVGTTQIFAPLTGSTGFTKSGTGTLQINGNSVGYTGVTTVNAGTLAVSNTLALGLSTAASNLVLNNGATIVLSTPPFTHNYTLTGGVVNVQTSNTVWSGSPTLTASTTLNLNGTSTTGALSGNLADTGANILSVTRSDTGRMTLSGNNSYTGATTITRGELQLGSAGALSAGSNLVFNGAAGTGGAIVLTSSSGNFTRSLGTGAGQVQWLGDGGFKSSGTDRNVNLGGAGAMLTWGAGGFVPDGNRLILGTNSNNLLDFQNGIDLTGGVRAVQGDGGNITGHARLSGTLSGTGGLNQVGNGFLELSGANTYSGGTTLTSGTLLVGSDANLGDASGTLTFNGGTLQNTGAFTTGRATTLNAAGGTFLANMNLVMNGPISGTGRLTKTGAATLTLTGANNYTGGTTISAGTLQVGNGGTSGSIAGNITNNGVLAFSRSDASIFGGAASGTGSLDQRGTGTTVLSGANTYTGGTTISAGTLQIGNGGTAGSILGNVADNGILAFNRSDGVTFGGIVSGGGSLEQRGAGTLTLTGANSYTGGTTLAGGTLSVASDGNLGATSGQLTFSGGTLLNTAAFTTGRTVALNAPGGTFQTNANLVASGPIGGVGRLTKTGASTLTLTGADTYTGGTTIGAGTLQIGNGGTSGSIVGDVIDNGALVFDRSDAVIFGGGISGSGGITKQQASALTLTGNSAAFAGTTSIVDGTLVVNGALGGTLNVLSGGRLQGTGAVGTTNVAAGGTLAAGDPFGTLTVAGNLGFATGSTFEVKTDPAGVMNLLHATGAATITGGTVNVVTESSIFRNGARYTILTADAGRTGLFDAVTQNFLLLDMTLAYDANHVYLDVARNSTTLCSLAVTRNQCATSRPDIYLGPSNVIVDAVRSLPDLPSIQNALDLLSGEVHASARAAQLEDSRYIREAVIDRLHQASDPKVRPITGSASLASNEIASAEGAVWGHAFGFSGYQNGDGNAARIDSAVSGFFAGADRLVGDNLRLGVAAGYSGSSYGVDARTSSASSSDYHLAFYSGKQWGPLGLRFGTAYTWHDIHTNRSTVFPGFSDTEQAAYSARTAQVFGEAGYAMHVDRLAFEPFVQLAQVHLGTDGFDESGEEAALRIAKSNDDMTYTTIGLHAARTFELPDKTIATTRGTLGWRKAFGDSVPVSTNAIGNSPTFAIAGVPIAKDALVIDVGVDAHVAENADLGIGYNGQISPDGSDNGARVHFTLRF